MADSKLKITIEADGRKAVAEVKRLTDAIKEAESAVKDAELGGDPKKIQAANQVLALQRERYAELSTEVLATAQAYETLQREEQQAAAAAKKAAEDAVNAAKKQREAAISSANKMRELGEKISNLGVRISAVFTLPVVAIGALVGRNEELQKSLLPIKKEFEGITNELAQALIPVIQDLTPAILDIVRGVGDLVKSFSALSVEQKENILRWIGIAAIIGPAITIIGQVVGTIGTLKAVLLETGPGLVSFAAKMWAAVAPIAAVTLAIAALVELFRMDETKQALALLWGKIGETVTGDKMRGAIATQTAYTKLGGGQKSLLNDTETGAMIRSFLTPRAMGGRVVAGRSYMVGENGPEPFIPDTSGVILPNSRMGNGVTVIVDYKPFISTVDQMQATKTLTPIIQQALRGQTGRGQVYG